MPIEIIDDMSNKDYHAHSAISKSYLDRVHRSMAHAKLPRGAPTPALIQGGGIHAAA